jgi:hypothetical protein
VSPASLPTASVPFAHLKGLACRPYFSWLMQSPLCAVHAATTFRRYHLDTGAANEHVPMNDQGYYLPLWQVSPLASLQA